MVDVATAEHHGVCPDCEGYGEHPCDEDQDKCVGCLAGEHDACPSCGGDGSFAVWQARRRLAGRS